jgi:hypothetical protein
MAADLTQYEEEQRAEAAHKRAMEKLAAEERIAKVQADAEVKKTRAENRPISVGIVAALCVLLAVIGGLTYGCTLPPDPLDSSIEQIEQQREKDCIAAGGGWVPADMTQGAGETGLCVLPGSTGSR